jgi:hypothetical protein
LFKSSIKWKFILIICADVVYYSCNTGVNPFGGTSASTQSNVSNPFGANLGGGAQPSLFGSQANTGFGQPSGGFGNQPTTAAGFGQPTGGFGNQPASAAGFGAQTPMMGGFGNPPTSAVGGFGAQTSLSGGYGQPPSNPGSFNLGGFGQPSATGGFGQPSAPGGFGQPSGGFGGTGMTNQISNQNGVFSSVGPTSASGGFGAFSQTQTMPNQFGSSMSGQFDNKMGGDHGFPAGWGGQPVGATNPQSVNPFMVC